MSEKRFLLKTDKRTYIVDKEQNHKIRDMYKSCEVLNELYEENEQLKQENEKLLKQLKITTFHLLSDECNLTDKQIKKIREEIENERTR